MAISNVKFVVSAEGTEKVVSAIQQIKINTKSTVDVLIGLNNTLKKIERRGLSGLQSEFNKTTSASKKLEMQVKKLESANERLKATNTKLTAANKKLRDSVVSGTAAVKKQGKGIRNLIPHVAAVTLSYMAMRRAVHAVIEALKAGADFEHQMAIVGGVVRATTAEFEMLADAARKAGETTVWTATESANALRFLGMAGFDAAESIKALGGVLNLALIGEMDLSRATDIATDTLRAFGLEADELGRVVDVMVGTITRSNTNIESMGQAMKFVAPVASKLGYTVEQVSAMIGVLSQSGIKAGIAGRALRMSFLKSIGAARSLGLESTNLIGILKELASQNMGAAELTSTLKDMFGLRSTPAMLTLIAGIDQLETFTETLNNAKGETDEFIERLDTTTVAFKKLKSVIVDVSIEVFLEYADDLKEALKDLAQVINNNKDEIKDFFDALATGGGLVKDAAVGPLKALSAIIKTINTAGHLLGVVNLFGEWAKAVVKIASPLSQLNKGLGQVEEGFQAITDEVIGVNDLNSALITANRLYQERLALMAEQAEMEDEFDLKIRIGIEETDILEDTVGAFEMVMTHAGVASAEAYMEAFQGGLQESGLFDEDFISKEGEKISKKVISNAESIRKKLTAMEIAYSKKLLEQLAAISDEGVKGVIVEELNKLALSYVAKIDMVDEYSSENVTLHKEMYAKILALLKGLMGDTKKEYSSLYKAQRKEFDVLAAQYEEENIDQKVYLKYLEWMGKQVKSEETYRNDKLQAMKSLYGDMNVITEEYLYAQQEYLELEYQKFMELLGLKDIATRDFTEEQKRLYATLNEWMKQQYEKTFESVVDSAKNLFTGDVFGDSMSQNINKMRKSMMKLIDVYEELPKVLKEIEALQERATSKDWSKLFPQGIEVPQMFDAEQEMEDVSFDQMVTAFEKAMEDMNAAEQERFKEAAKIIEKEKQLRESAGNAATEAQIQGISAQLGAWGQLFGSVKMLFAENSKEREMFAAAEKIATMAQIVLQAVLAIATAGTGGEGYTALARVAAMAAAMAALLSGVGLSIGGGGGSDSAPPPPPSTVLGAEAGTASESIANALEMLEDVNVEQYGALLKIYAEIQQLNQNITGLVTGLIKGVGGGFGTLQTPEFDFIGPFESVWNSMTDGLSDFFKSIGKYTLLLGSFTGMLMGWLTDLVGSLFGWLADFLFGGGGYVKALAAGIQIDEQLLGDIIKGGDVLAKIFADIHKHTEGGIFSDDKNEYWTEYADLDKDAIRLLTKIFKNIGDAFVSLAEGLGVDVQKVYEYILPKMKLDLKGMDADQIAKAVSAFFANLTDQMAEDLFGDIIKKYQKVGEGLFETAVRLVMEKEIFLSVLDMTQQSFKGTAEAAIEMSQAIIDLMGGLEKFTEGAQAYFDAFLTESEKSAFLFKNLKKAFAGFEGDIEMPETRQGFKDLMAGIDLTTEAGQKLYAALLGIAAASGAYYDALEDAMETLLDLGNRLTETDLEKTIKDIIKDYEEGFQALGTKYGIDISATTLSGIEKELAEKARLAEIEKEYWSDMKDNLEDINSLIEGIEDGTVDPEALKKHFQDIFDAIGEILDPEALVKGLHEFAMEMAPGIEELDNLIYYFGQYKDRAPDLANISTLLDALAQSMADFAYFEGLSGAGEGQGIWTPEQSAIAFTDMMEDIDTAISAVTDAQTTHAGAGGHLEDYLKRTKSYLIGLKSLLEDFEDELGSDLTGPGAKKEIRKILSDLGQNDFESAIAYLLKQQEELEKLGPSDELDKVNDSLKRLAKAAEEFAKMEQQQFDLMKVEMGLMTNAAYMAKRQSEIDKRYEQYGMSSAEMIKAFAGMTLDDLKAVADALGIDWTDIANDIAFLIEQERELDRVRRAQAELLGKDPGLWDIAERYKINYDDIDTQFAQNIVNKFLEMSAEEVRAWAGQLGVSVDQLIDDIMRLASTFEAVADTIKKAQVQLAGLDVSLWEIAERYGVKYGDLDKDFARDIMRKFLDMTVAEVEAWAKALGVTTDQLVDDIMKLMAAFGFGTLTIRDMAEQIKDIFQGVNDFLLDAGAAIKASRMWEMLLQLAIPFDAVPIPGEAPLTPTPEELANMSEQLSEWFYLAEAAARELGQAELETIRLEEQMLDSISSLISQIDQTIRNIKYSDLNVALPKQKAEEAQQDYDKLFSAALSGGTEDVNKYLGFAQTYLQQQQNAYKSSEEYQDVYASVMGDLETVKGIAEAGGYDAKILEELKKGNDLTVEQTEAYKEAMVEVTRKWEHGINWISKWVGKLERAAIALTIDWGDFDGPAAEVLQKLMDLVEAYGWGNQITLEFIADMGAWAASDIGKAIEIMDDIAAKSGGWNSEATITFMAALGDNIENLTDAKAVMDHMLAEGVTWDDKVAVAFWGEIGDNISNAKDATSALEYMLLNGATWDSKALIEFVGKIGDNLTNIQDAKDVLQYMLLNGAAWDDEATITFVGKMAGLMQDATDATSMLNYLIGEGAEWDDEAIINFIGNLDPAIFDGLAEKMDFLGFVGTEAGWGSEAVLEFVGRLADDGETTWVDIEKYLELMDVDQSVILGLQLKYDQENSTWGSIGEFTEAIADMSTLSDTETKRIKAEYEATGSTWTSWSAYSAAIDKMNLDPESKAEMEAVWLDKNGWASYDKVAEALTNMGMDQSLIATMEAQYLDGDLTLSEFQKLLSGMGLDAGEIMKIQQELSGSIEVAMPDQLDFWASNIAALYSIINNTALIANVLTGQSIAGAEWGAAIGSIYSKWVAALVDVGGTPDAVSIAMSSLPTPDDYPGGGAITGEVSLTGSALDYLADIRTRTGATATNIYKLWRSLTDGVIAITNGNIDLGVQSYQVFRYGGIIDEPTLGLVGEAGYPEAVIPMMDGYNIPVKWVNGGSTQAGANGEEIELLRELVELQKEQIDTLKAKDTAPKVNVNIDGQGMVAEAGRYVSEKSRRGTLDVRAH